MKLAPRCQTRPSVSSSLGRAKQHTKHERMLRSNLDEKLCLLMLGFMLVRVWLSDCNCWHLQIRGHWLMAKKIDLKHNL